MKASWIASATFASVVACTHGAPPAFPKGESWTLPLVGPLEGGQLVVPVYVQDAGPYLMVIDPDSPTTVIDDVIVKQLGVPTAPFGELVDEADTPRRVYAAEVQSLRIGTLTLGREYYVIMKAGTVTAAGREVHGVIGRDVLADSLAFGFDRERGVAYVTTQKGFAPPANATALGYSDLSRPELVSRRMVTAGVGAMSAHVHVDLGAPASQLRSALWPRAGLDQVAATFDIRDEAGTIHHLEGGGMASLVSVGPVSADHVVFAPYDDKRWDQEMIDGTVALDALRKFNVWVNWDKRKFYLAQRDTDEIATAADRIKRWHDAALDRCATGGCATIKMLVPAQVPDGPKPRAVVMIDRDAATTPLELVLAPIGTDGKPAALPSLIVNLPAGVTSASTQLPPDYADTKLVVVDASAYPRACPHGGGCIDSIAP